jgi:hypothetical protein
MGKEKIQPSAAHTLLQVFEGAWHTTGQTEATDESPAIQIAGTDTYEWLPGRFFMAHHADVRMGEEEAKTLEIIGYDAATQKYPTHFFDNQGNTGTYQAHVHEGIWTFQGATDRATLTISVDGNTMTAHWERTQDRIHWLSWMQLTLSRIR